MAKATKKAAPKASQLKAVPKFDPVKSYNWQADSDFILKGNELEFIYKTLFSILSKEEAQMILAANTSFTVLQGLIKQGLERGIVTEAPEIE